MASRRNFCAYLTAARRERNMTIDEIAGVTRIPARSLEYLESGQFEKLPADVFVRGFLRSYARCVGLNADEAIRRYTRCGMTPAPVSTPLADELASSMATLDERDYSTAVRRVAPQHPSEASPSLEGGKPEETRAEAGRAAEEAARSSEEPRRASQGKAEADEVGQDEAERDEAERERAEAGKEARELAGRAASPEPRAQGSGKRRKRRRKRKQRSAAAGKQASGTLGTEQEASPEAEQEAATRASVAEASQSDEESVLLTAASDAQNVQANAPEPGDGVAEPERTEVHQDTATSSGADDRPVRRAAHRHGTARARTAAKPRPVLVIDDDRPEEAERIQDERAERADASWRSFLPPALLDSDEGSHRGALTLAVIILVIVATLTMSYLLRRPSGSGDGITQDIVTPADGSLVARA